MPFLPLLLHYLPISKTECKDEEEATIGSRWEREEGQTKFLTPSRAGKKLVWGARGRLEALPNSKCSRLLNLSSHTRGRQTLHRSGD